MNKVYKVVWSKVKNTYVVASELAKSHTKAPKSGVIGWTLVCGVLAGVLSTGMVMPVFAAGDANKIVNGSTSTVTGADVKAYLDAYMRVLAGDGWYSVAIGQGTRVTNAKHDLAIGTSASATGNGSMAIGSHATANADGAIAIGCAGTSYSGETVTRATGTGSMAIGLNSYVRGTRGIAIGIGTREKDDYGIVIGTGGISEGGRSTALGNLAYATGENSLALGSGARADGTDSVTTGHQGTVFTRAVAVGADSFACNENAMALGSLAMSSGKNSVAIGYGSNADEENVVSFGGKRTVWSSVNGSVQSESYGVETRRLTNVSPGINPTDVATVSQLPKVTVYSAGNNITISNGTISATDYIGKNGISVTNEPVETEISYGSLLDRYNGSVSLLLNSCPDISTNLNPAINLGSMTTQEALDFLYENRNNYEAVANSPLSYAVSMYGNNIWDFYTALKAFSEGVYVETDYKNFISATADGEIVENDVRMVSGDTVYKALRDIGAIDQENVVLYDDDSKSKVTLGGTRGTTLTNLKAGELSRTSTDAVIGNQLWTTNQNVAGMKTSINTNTNNIASLNTSVTNALESITSISGLVDTVNTLKADKSLNNLDDAGRQVIATAAANAVQEYIAGNNKIVLNGVAMNNVTPDDWSSIDDELALKADKDDVYSKSETDTLLDAKADVSYVDEQLSAKANADEVYVKDEVDTMLNSKADKDSVYTKDEADVLLDAKADKTDLDSKADKAELEAKADKDASNIDVDAWANKLGTGSVEKGNTGLVNGGTVYDAISQFNYNNGLVKEQDGIIYMGAESDSKVISVYNKDGNGRVITGVMTNPEDPSSVANVGYVNAVAENATNQLHDAIGRVDSRVDKIGAQSAALAGLHPFELDGDQKWNVAAAYGGYKSEKAGAVGLFYKPSGNVLVSASSTVGDDSNMYNIGVSVALDKGNIGMTKAQLAKTVQQQNDVISKQNERIVEQDARIARLEAAMTKQK